MFGDEDALASFTGPRHLVKRVETALEIRRRADLSRRISLYSDTDGRASKHDGNYVIASTFTFSYGEGALLQLLQDESISGEVEIIWRYGKSTRPVSEPMSALETALREWYPITASEAPLPLRAIRSGWTRVFDYSRNFLGCRSSTYLVNHASIMCRYAALRLKGILDRIYSRCRMSFNK